MYFGYFYGAKHQNASSFCHLINLILHFVDDAFESVYESFSPNSDVVKLNLRKFLGKFPW